MQIKDWHAMTAQNLQVYKSNDLMAANYKLSVAETRIILTCIAKISRDPTMVVTDSEMYGFTAKEYAELCEISLMAAYSDLKEAVDQLFDRHILFSMSDRERKTRWIQTADYIVGEGRVMIRFSKDVLPYLVNLKANFTKYSLRAVVRLSSPHAFRMYDLIIKHRFKLSPTVLIKIEDIRFGLALDNAYPLYADLRKRVIEPALEMISDETDIEILGFEPKREGRKIVAIEISYRERKDFNPNPVQEDIFERDVTPKVEEPKAAKKKVRSKTITQEEIRKAARPGETTEQVVARLKMEQRKADYA
jgi:plasmid replication initiation protein